MLDVERTEPRDGDSGAHVARKVPKRECPTGADWGGDASRLPARVRHGCSARQRRLAARALTRHELVPVTAPSSIGGLALTSRYSIPLDGTSPTLRRAWAAARKAPTNGWGASAVDETWGTYNVATKNG
jgi:hypothetical protein